MPSTEEIIHISGRFDRPIKVRQKAVNYYQKQGNLIAHTETSGLNARQLALMFKDPGWGFVHIAGTGAGECVSQYKKSRYEIIGDPFARKITDLTWVRSDDYGGKKAAFVRALVVPYSHKPTGRVLIHQVIHMPLDNTKPRAEAWIDCTRGLKDLQKDLNKFYPKAHHVVSADWNKNWREKDEKAQMVKHLILPLNLQYSWQGEVPASGGTHPQPGPDAIIDGFLTDLKIKDCFLLRDMPDSDHRGMKGKVLIG